MRDHPTLTSSGMRIAFVALLLAALGGLAWYVTSIDPQLEPVDLKPGPEKVEGPRIVYPVNQHPELRLADGSKREVRSLLNIKAPMSFGEFVWDENGVPDGPGWIRVDLANQTISVFRGGHEIGSAVILFGTDGKPTPTGVFPVLEMRRQHRSNLYDAEMPFMMRLTYDGVALHASDVRKGSATHGCIGLPDGFARRVFSATEIGDVVSIEDGKS